MSRLVAALAPLVALVPAVAFADAAVPVLAVVTWPAIALALVPIVAIEALVARRRLGLGWRRALALSAVANAASTAVGVPLASGALLAPLVVAGALRLGRRAVATPSPAWLQRMAGAPAVVLGVALICIPCFLASVFVERWVARRFLRPEEPSSVRAWSWIAHLWSYGALVAVLLGLAAWTGGHG